MIIFSGKDYRNIKNDKGLTFTMEGTSFSNITGSGCFGFSGALNKSFNFIGLDKLSGQFTTEILDLRNYIELSVLDKYKFDYVVCTAWDQISNNIYENNIKSTNNLIKYFSNKNLKGIIFISSIYVSTSVDIQYSRSKIDSENIIFDSSIPFIIIRPDMIYSINENKIQLCLLFSKLSSNDLSFNTTLVNSILYNNSGVGESVYATSYWWDDSESRVLISNSNIQSSKLKDVNSS